MKNFRLSTKAFSSRIYFFFLVFLLISLPVLMNSCERERSRVFSTSPDTSGTGYWSEPSLDALRLAVARDTANVHINIDTVLAGHIEYRMIIARTVDTALDTFVMSSGLVLDMIVVHLDDETIAQFDTLALVSYNTSLDDLLDTYPISSAGPMEMYPFNYYFWFQNLYNTYPLSDLFEDISCISGASPVIQFRIPPSSTDSIELTIEEDKYTFTFRILDDTVYPEINNYWIVEVVDDHAVLIERG